MPTKKEDAPKNLVQKLAEVILEIGPMSPSGENKFHHYKYFSDEQISSAFRDKLAKRNIVITPQVMDYEIREFQTAKGGHSFLTTMKVMWTIQDGDSDMHDDIIAVTVGQGDDPGDKGANKAMTGAFKYFLLKMGMIGGEGDAEADESTDKRSVGAAKSAMTISDSDIKDVQRGGRSKNATQAQVKRVRVLAGQLGLTPPGVAIIIKEVLDKDVDLGVGDQGPPLVEFLGKLGAEDIGMVVQKMTEMKELNEAEERQRASLDEESAEAVMTGYDG